MKKLISLVGFLLMILMIGSCKKDTSTTYTIKYQLIAYSQADYSYFQILDYKDASGNFVNGYSSDSVIAQSWSKTISVTKPFTAKFVVQSGNFTSNPYQYHLVIFVNNTQDTVIKDGLATPHSGAFSDSVQYTIP